MRRRALALALLLLLGGCRSDSSLEPIALDGSPREPDVAGLVVRVSRESITIAGHGRFDVSPQLQCFATSSLETVPLLGRLHHFVHAGVDGDSVVWLAGFGPVAELPGEKPTVFYVGTVTGMRGRDRVQFRDGTVLSLAKDLGAPDKGNRIRVDIEPSNGVVRAYVPAGLTIVSR